MSGITTGFPAELVLALIGYHRAASGSASEGEPDAHQHLAVASTGLQRLADRLLLLARDQGDELD